MENTVLPYNRAHENVREIAGADGKSLYTCCYMADMPRATVVIVHGFTENAFKYSEIIHSLLRNGYNVLIYDQRGHGRSWRDPAVKGTDPGKLGCREKHQSGKQRTFKQCVFQPAVF